MKIYNNLNLNRKHRNSVIAIGNFDGIHLGHLKVINEAKKMAKKKPMFGVSNYHKRTPKKRPGRIRKKYGPGVKRPKKYKGQGR